MRIKLVFEDWQKRGISIYNAEEGVELSMGLFHSGTTFDGEIYFNSEDQAEFEEALNKGYQPTFWIAKE